MKIKDLKNNLEIFLQHIDSIKDTLPMTTVLLRPYTKKSIREYLDFMEKNGERVLVEGEEKWLIKDSNSTMFKTLGKNASISGLAIKIINEGLFVSLISQYDAFINRLLRCVFKIKPDILNGSDRNLTFSQLISMNSLDEAREYIVEKEVETVLRKSHSEHFDYLEKQFNIELRKNLDIWPIFIEITERRNLFVHCDGYVSSQYLKVCLEKKADINSVKVGDRLKVDINYFNSAYKCLYEISVKLTHTLLRKLEPNSLKHHDKDLNMICYDLLTLKNFNLCDTLLKFSCNQVRHSDLATKNVFTINSAISKYLQGKEDEAKAIMESKDWSASSDNFKIANAILTGDYEKAYSIMIKIGTSPDLNKNCYKEWPLFYKIRSEEKFKDTYKLIFNEDYKVLETPIRAAQELIENHNKTIRAERLAKTAIETEKPELSSPVKKARKKISAKQV